MVNERTQIYLHVFIQWLAHRGVLNEWMDEMIRETEHTIANGWDLEVRVRRLQNTNAVGQLVNSSFGKMRSVKGGPFWHNEQYHWTKVSHKLMQQLKEDKENEII